jgi:RNA polymerase sigma-70 factor (ECF subfamily)
MVHRAAERVREGRPRFTVAPEKHRELLQKFIAAAQSGHRAAIRELLAEDVTTLGDGGGKATSVLGWLLGRDRVTNLFWAHALRFGPRMTYRLATINGEPGLLRYIDGKVESATCCVTDGERIVGIYSVRNPDKLAHIPPLH